MSYLYGDSTPSPLDSNFLQFLEEALGMSVHLLLAGERMRRGRERIAALREEAERDVRAIGALGASVAHLLREGPKGDATPHAVACAELIAEQAVETVRRRLGEVQATLETNVAAVESEAALERGGCLKALEALLRRGDPPATTTSLHLAAQDGRYLCKRTTKTPYGVAWTLEVDIAPPHALGQIARIDRFCPQLEISIPEIGGWLRKEVRNRTHRLEKLLLTEMTLTPDGALLRLRSTLDEGAPGFDATYAADAAGVRLTRVGDPGDPFEPSEPDTAKLLALHERLRGLAFAIDRGEGRLEDATLDERSIAELVDPGVLVDRLVAGMAPIVAEIAQHSLSGTELVLKKLLGDNRREEIFVSKSSLREKLAPLPEPLRAYFAPLALSGPGVRPASMPPAAVPRESVPDAG